MSVKALERLGTGFLGSALLAATAVALWVIGAGHLPAFRGHESVFFFSLFACTLPAAAFLFPYVVDTGYVLRGWHHRLHPLIAAAFFTLVHGAWAVLAGFFVNRLGADWAGTLPAVWPAWRLSWLPPDLEGRASEWVVSGLPPVAAGWAGLLGKNVLGWSAAGWIGAGMAIHCALVVAWKRSRPPAPRLPAVGVAFALVLLVQYLVVTRFA